MKYRVKCAGFHFSLCIKHQHSWLDNILPSMYMKELHILVPFGEVHQCDCFWSMIHEWK